MKKHFLVVYLRPISLNHFQWQKKFKLKKSIVDNNEVLSKITLF